MSPRGPLRARPAIEASGLKGMGPGEGHRGSCVAHEGHEEEGRKQVVEMAMSDYKWKKGTLFDPEFLYQYKHFADKQFPYSIALQGFGSFESQAVPEDETCVFADVLEHEICAYEPRGYLYGPLSFVDAQRHGKRLRCMNTPLRIPSFVEQDVLPIASCGASAILLVEHYPVFQELTKSTIVDETGILLVTGSGIPRLGTRRLVHRLERECNLPVLLLTDNDTWGYWIYSVLKRGLMAPAMESKYAAIKNVSFLGVRAGDWKRFGVPIERLRSWESQWDLRLKELRKQRFFRSRQWQIEFDRFAADRCGLDLRVLVEHLGVSEFTRTFLKPRLTRGRVMRRRG